MPQKRKRIAVLDLETDPFEYGKVPQPFVAGLYDGQDFMYIWSPDCIAKIVERLAKWKEPLIIFAHNGGKFDWLYFLEYLPPGEMRIVNNRIIQARLGDHILRDSFAILPFPLKDFDKDDIDYDKMRKEVREQHREEIIKYLRKDCTALHELVSAFFDEFGDKLTVGSSSMKQLQRFHSFTRGGERFDEKFRDDFYFGGRNQCFKAGIIRQPLKIYDVNSMYPYVMKSYLHPIGTSYTISTRVEHNTCFVVATGYNYGAFPMRTKDGSLDFTVPHGRFSTTIHEWNAALETGAFKPTKVHKTYGFDERITFAEFIDHFYDERAAARARGDKIHALFYKFVLNSAYGKFAQNPENFYEWCITHADEVLNEQCPVCPKEINPDCLHCQGSGFKWTPAAIHQGKYTIWQSPLLQHHFYNVTTGASITGAARAVLLRGISHAVNPIYCDTDSIICEALEGLPLSESDLGAWKLEGSGDLAAVCGKKLYAVYASKGDCVDCKGNNHTPDVHPRELVTVKKAHKGARLSGDEIMRIAKGDTIEYANPVPCFKLDGNHVFTKRKIRRTA